MIDYSAMDAFCKVPTWDTGHALDQRRFVDALMEIVDHSEFHPGEMIDYIRRNHAASTWPHSEEKIESALNSLEQQAYAVWYSRHKDRQR